MEKAYFKIISYCLHTNIYKIINFTEFLSCYNLLSKKLHSFVIHSSKNTYFLVAFVFDQNVYIHLINAVVGRQLQNSHGNFKTL